MRSCQPQWTCLEHYYPSLDTSFSFPFLQMHGAVFRFPSKALSIKAFSLFGWQFSKSLFGSVLQQRGLVVFLMLYGLLFFFNTTRPKHESIDHFSLALLYLFPFSFTTWRATLFMWLQENSNGKKKGYEGKENGQTGGSKIGAK